MDTKVVLDTIWVLITGFLVFFMNLGFAAVESGLARQKNTVNILSKNFIVFAVSSLGFLLLGWGLMFGDGNGFIGLKGLFMLTGADTSPARATPIRAFTPPFPGPVSPSGPSSSSSWSSAARRPPSYPAPPPSASSTYPSSYFRLCLR
jgi:hypothetical protein